MTRISIGLFWASLYLYVPVLPLHITTITGNLEIVGLILSSYAIAQLLLRIPIGLLADRIGKKRLCLVAITLSSMSAILLMFSNNGQMLFFSRSLTGLAAAGWVPISVLYSSYFSDKNAAKSMSEAVMINSIGLLTATYFGGMISEHFGINVVFIIASSLGACSGICMFFTKEPVVFKKESKLLPLTSLVNKNLLKICVVGMCLFYLTFSTIYAFIPIYLQKIGYSETNIGLIISLSLVASLFGAGYLPKIKKTLNNKTILLSTWTLMIITTLLTPLSTTIGVILFLQFFCGIGRGIITALLMSLVIQHTDLKNRSTVMGVYQSLYSIGMFLGPFLSGISASKFGVESIFYVAIIFCIIGMFIGMFIADPLESK
ncbi:MAG: MFS transporter [Dehalococcoidia bacterium]